jgi:tetratricopeptide (TPR) repeat protein
MGEAANISATANQRQWRTPAFYLSLASLLGVLMILFVVVYHNGQPTPSAPTKPTDSGFKTAASLQPPAGEAKHTVTPPEIPNATKSNPPVAQPAKTPEQPKPTSVDEQAATEELRQANTAIEAKRFNEAAGVLSRLKASRPNDSRVWLALGELNLGLHNLDVAVEDLRESIRLNPEEARAYGCLYRAYMDMGRDSEAQEAMNTSIRLALKSYSPEQRKAFADQAAINLLKVARAAVRLNQTSIMAENLSLLKKQTNKGSITWLAIGELDLGLQNFDAAVEDLSESIRLKPDSADAHIDIGRAFFMLDKYREAGEAFKTAIRLEPQDFRGHLLLGSTFTATEQWEAAVQELEAAVRLNTSDPIAYIELGRAYASVGRHLDEVLAFKTAIKLDPQSVMAHTNLALAYQIAGNHLEAMRSYETVAKLDPSFAAELKPFLEAPPEKRTQPPPVPAQPPRAANRPNPKGQDNDNYVLEKLPQVQISPRFEGDRKLSMGRWSYEAYRVTDKKNGSVSFMLNLNIELQPVGITVPPVLVKVSARTRANRQIGSGTLFARGLGFGEMLPYEGFLSLDSLDNIDIISIQGNGF